jgi:hypothetical protein
MENRIGRLVLAVIAVAALGMLIPATSRAQIHDPNGSGGGSCHQVAPETGPASGALKGGASLELRYWTWLAQRLGPKAGANRSTGISQYSRPVFAPVTWRSSQR